VDKKEYGEEIREGTTRDKVSNISKRKHIRRTPTKAECC